MMSTPGCSRPVTTTQQGIHEGLIARVEKQKNALFQKPVAAFNRLAFEAADHQLKTSGRPLILDSGCGVGASSRQLARCFPQHLVIGVDRSEKRLQKKIGPQPDNCLLLRADLVDFWRLAQAAAWQPEYHFLLYPNPYPKKRDLKQRWPAHPVFPSLVALGGHLISRSNWRIYLDEMQAALAVYGLNAQVTPWVVHQPLTPFERKYHDSGQALWQLTLPRGGFIDERFKN